MSTTEKNIPAFEAEEGMGVEAPKRKVAVVGGGPSGSLAAIYFAQRNWQVTLFEKRPDIRDPENASNLSSRTINLALSHRGITALKGTNLGLDKKLLSKAIPTKGRMIHTKTNAQLSQLYGINDQCINSIDRNEMNGILLSELEKFPHAKVIFDHTLDRCDLDAGRLYFINAKKDSFVFDCDLIVGSDGINSTVRQSILQRSRANISMQYIDHDYCELTIPAAKGLKSDKFQLDNHHLHIWPRQTYMMTALANLNGSFSCAFFAPREMFDAMDTKEKFLKLFDKEFSDVMPLVDRDTLAQEFMDNPRGSLATVKCDPHYYKGRAVLIGDAAHCMVPFFGQGMNSSLEDVTKLFEQLDAAHDEDEKSISLVKEYDTKVIERALAKYSQHRTKDAAAICDLSLRNYIEMRKSVVTWSYQIRKQLETFLYHYIPDTVAPLYIMVTFSSMRYTEAMRRWDRQTEILSNAIRSVAILLMMLIVFLVYLSTPKSLLSFFPC